MILVKCIDNHPGHDSIFNNETHEKARIFLMLVVLTDEHACEFVVWSGGLLQSIVCKTQPSQGNFFEIDLIRQSNNLKKFSCPFVSFVV